MAAIWGATWAAIKLGLEDLPPIFLAAVRYLAAGLILAMFIRGIGNAFAGERWRRTILSALLVNTGTYGLLFWGMLTVPSGIAGLVNLSIIPVALFVLAIATGEERPSMRHVGALILGLAGLVALFWSKLDGSDSRQFAGLAAVVIGSLSYCFGSVVGRPILNHVQPLQLTSAQALVGGAALAATSLVLEELEPSTVVAIFEPKAFGALAFLVIAGTIIAYSIYLHLLDRWGTARAGLYAFVSPIVALMLGNKLFGERIGMIELIGAALMLGAAALSMTRPSQQA
jgi:drug/metabolite transporter (DMT)-like permease